MSAILELESTKVKQLIKQGKRLVPDSEGKYTILGGAINCVNSAGEFYTAPDRVIELFNNSSILQRRVKNGAVKAEVGHPDVSNYPDTASQLKRLLTIDELRVCALITGIRLLKPLKVDFQDQPVIPIELDIIPQGKYGDLLKQDLDNPYSNTAFSIRSLVKKTTIGFKTYKELTNIITFDWVVEPGIAIANKVDTLLNQDKLAPSTEEHLMLTEDMLINLDSFIDNITIESDRELYNSIKYEILKCSKDNGCKYDW